MNVQRVRVGDLVTLTRRPVDVDASHDYTFLGVSAAGGGCFKKPPVPGSQISSRAFRVEAGDFLYSRLFAWKGSFEIAGPEEQGCLVSGEFPAFIVDTERMDSRWLRYWLLSDAGLRAVGDRSSGSTPGSRNRLREDRFLDIRVPLPSLDEQRAAVDGLDRLYAATGRLAARSGDAAELVKALSVSTCARPDLSNEEKSAAGWRHIDLDSLMVPVVDRVSVSPEESYPNLGIYSFGRGVFEKPKIDGGSTSAQSLNRVRAGQVIYSRLFAFEGAYSHVPPAFDGYFVSNEFPTFDPASEQLDARWLASCLRSPDRWAELAGSSKGLGVRRQRISVEAVLAYRVWVPPIDHQRVMVQIMQVLETSQDWRDRAQGRINSLLPAALNEAFAGLR